VTKQEEATAAQASIGDVAGCAARVDAQVRAVLGRVLAQRRSVETALGYVTVLSPRTRANCWAIAEAAGHEGWGRMQGLLRSYRWDWANLRAQLPGLAAAWLPGRPGDLTGPGIAIDETAHIKAGDATACVAPQHAGCTGQVENCVTTVFSAYVTAGGQAWVDFDVYLPRRWAGDLPRLAPLQCPAAQHRRDRVTSCGRKEVTECNRSSRTAHSAQRQRSHAPENRDCITSSRAQGYGKGKLTAVSRSF